MYCVLRRLGLCDLPVSDTRDTKRRVQVSLLHRQEGTIDRVEICTHPLIPVFTSFQTSFIAENLVTVLYCIQDIPGLNVGMKLLTLTEILLQSHPYMVRQIGYGQFLPFAVSPLYGTSNRLRPVPSFCSLTPIRYVK